MAELLTRKQIEEVVVRVARETLGMGDSISDQEILKGTWSEFGTDSLDMLTIRIGVEGRVKYDLGISIFLTDNDGIGQIDQDSYTSVWGLVNLVEELVSVRSNQ